jgi:hypothetical protein
MLNAMLPLLFSLALWLAAVLVAILTRGTRW